jgi:hypothetical protein
MSKGATKGMTSEQNAQFRKDHGFEVVGPPDLPETVGLRYPICIQGFLCLGKKLISLIGWKKDRHNSV